MILTGDIGGTKTVLAIFSADSGPHKPLMERTYPSIHYLGLEDIVHEFLREVDAPIDSAYFGVAGPVVDGYANITNLTWAIDETHLKSTFGWSAVKLLNDLEAVAYAVPILEADDLHTLSAGKPVPGGNIGVLAPGTGLGEAFMTFEDGHYKAHASEGSHAAFGPVNSLQVGLLTYMRERKGFDHVSYERVCSGGLGIPNLYSYLRDTGYAPEPAWMMEKLADSDDITPVIIQSAKDKDHSCELCIATLNLFVSILGAEAGNLALKVLSTGGIYIGGGIPPRILSDLQHPAFLEALRSKGRFRQMLTNMPVHIILNTRAGLLGAAAYGLTARKYEAV
jgi:glucokinase